MKHLIKILRCLLPLLALASCTKSTDQGRPSEAGSEVKAVKIQAQAPMNEMIWWEDDGGRPLAVYSRASECYPQVITIHYGADGRIESVVETDDDEMGDAETENLDSLFRQYYDADCHVWSCEYTFRYREDGKLATVTYFEEKERGRDACAEVEARAGHHLEAAYRPVASYWESDINGGRMVLCISEVADTPEADNGRQRHWINCTPVEELDEDDWAFYFTPDIDSRTMPEEYNRYPKTIYIK